MQFYPGDWQRDTPLRSCSLAARGLWAEMLWIMHDGNPRGTMRVGQKSITKPEEIAAMVGAKPGDPVAELLAELEESGVYSRTEDGTIYSRRMERDSYISAVRRASGSEGGKVAQAKLRGKTEEAPGEAVAEEEKVESQLTDFDALWNVWARKVAKGAARKAFANTRKNQPPIADLLAIVAKLQASYEWTREGRKFQPHLATWLNREGWHDELTGTATPERGAVNLELLRAGGKAETRPDWSVADRLAKLAAALPKEMQDCALWRARILRLREHSSEMAEAGLAAMDAELLAHLKNESSAETLAGMDAKVRAAQARLAARSIESPAEIADRLWAQLLREHYGIPILSLFSAEAKAA